MTLVFIMLLLTVQEIDQDKNNQTTKHEEGKKKEKRESLTIFALKEDYSCNNVWLCIAIKLCM